MGTRFADSIALLKADHRMVEGLFNELKEANRSNTTRKIRGEGGSEKQIPSERAFAPPGITAVDLRALPDKMPHGKQECLKCADAGGRPPVSPAADHLQLC